MHSLLSIVEDGGQRQPERPAIGAPGRAYLSYRGLAEEVTAHMRALSRLGIEPGGRVGVALPNGPELAVAVLSASSYGVCAPLNPTGPPEELERAVTALGLRLVIAAPGIELAGAPVAHIEPDGADAGRFRLGQDHASASGGPPPRRPRPEDPALVLRTSGTTGQPKVVTLSHANLCVSARNVRRRLALGPQDRCLAVMPLWHIHGIVATMLASLRAGGSVVCTPGFSAIEFGRWLAESEATWYSAVPSMHQALIERAREHPDLVAGSRLRLIRSASSRLAAVDAARLEELFGVPVIEAYGMTEGAHQIASNPLPPRPRKRGSVGLPSCAVTIWGPDDQPLAAGERGEIVIRGDNLFAGYEGGVEPLRDGWFRTGDQGYLDDDGYLFITGRLKEMINRGGETIAPGEIDEVLLTHPDVVEAAAFGIPDARLGETVAAAVVRRGASEVSERELRSFARERLAPSKVPNRIALISALPKNGTGKVQRGALSTRLGTALSRPPSPDAAAGSPRRLAIERMLARHWAEVLELPAVTAHDELIALGADSLLAGRVASRLAADLGRRISLADVVAGATVAEQAGLIDEPEDGRHDAGPALRGGVES